MEEIILVGGGKVGVLQEGGGGGKVGCWEGGGSEAAGQAKVIQLSYITILLTEYYDTK